MKNSLSEEIGNLKTPPANKVLENIFERLFSCSIQDKTTLLLKWEDIGSTLRNGNLSKEEREYIEYHIRERFPHSHKSIADEERFQENLNITLFELLQTRNLDVANMIAYFPPRLIHEKYGEAVLFWVWGNLYSLL